MRSYCEHNIFRAQEDVNTIFAKTKKYIFFSLYHENALHGFYVYMLRNEQEYTWLLQILRILLFHDIGVKYTVIQLKRFGFGKGKDWEQLYDGAKKTSGIGLQFGRTCNGIAAEVQLCHASYWIMSS